MTVYVFLGPSLPVDDARRELDAAYLPPVSAGDVAALVEERPEAIAIVDGTFDQAPAVRHKEILYALSRGIPVFGAASMGALRAAELHTFGMIGIGRIFDAYRSGAIEDDDEVAVVHADATGGYRPLSEAMVNIRWGLAAARDAGVVDDAAHDALVAAAKDLFYPDRSWPAVAKGAAARGVPPDRIAAVSDFVRAHPPRAKRDDALELVRRVAAAQRDGFRDRPPAFELESTRMFRRFVQSSTYRAALSGCPHSPEAIALEARLFGPDRSAIERAALLLHFVADEAESLPPATSARELPSRPGRDGVPRRLADEVSALDRAAHGIARGMRDRLADLTPLALASAGIFPDVIRSMDAKLALRERFRVKTTTPEDEGISTDDLVAWYRARFDADDSPVEERAARLGLAPEAFIQELLMQYLVERAPRI